ncbi:hypothetical protein AVEN_57905-1 [Araneus ventricosus]|uniref:Transposable element P transposase-like GTP-binding insertion domain-containing protein n=2 Tax=Araneus ventricosus TaxID=182803 RepID=A0A4Y2KIA5_ARAVE|nr:hypothetical protein AVEN_57905-1 [Araneus ventricosus]
MIIEQKPPHEIAIAGGVDETADFSKATDVLECDDVENDMRVLISTPKRSLTEAHNFIIRVCFGNDPQSGEEVDSKHVHVSGLNTKNVKLAMQALSQSVGSALCYLTALNYLPSSASNTADFCTKIDYLFDSLKLPCTNAQNETFALGSFKTPRRMEELLREFIKTIQFQTNGKKIRFPSITRWQVTLSAFLLLVPELFEKVKFVLLSRFNKMP